MRKLSILLITLSTAALGLAQTTPSQNYPQVPVTQQTDQQNPTASGTKQVAQGTKLMAALDQPLSTKNSKVGDTFTASVQKDVPSSIDGSVAIPAGSKIQGQVVEAEQGKALPTVRGKGRLNMRFNSLTLPNGSSVPLSATLLSVHGTTKGASAGEEGEVSGGTSGKEAAKKVGIGAAIGTVGGLIFGSALK